MTSSISTSRRVCPAFTTLDKKLHVDSVRYLGDPEAIRAAAEAVARQAG